MNIYSITVPNEKLENNALNSVLNLKVSHYETDFLILRLRLYTLIVVFT